MKKKIDQAIKTITGESIMMDPSREMTFKDIFLTAILKPSDKEKTLNDQVSLFKLAEKIRDSSGECDFTSEEITKVKNKVAELGNPTITGRTSELLES